MSTPPSATSPGEADVTLRIDVDCAEAAVFDLAAELRRVPLTNATSRLHVRALELKRDILRWRSTRPDEAARRALLEELFVLQRCARAARVSTPSGAELARGRSCGAARP